MSDSWLLFGAESRPEKPRWHKRPLKWAISCHFLRRVPPSHEAGTHGRQWPVRLARPLWFVLDLDVMPFEGLEQRPKVWLVLSPAADGSGVNGPANLREAGRTD